VPGEVDAVPRGLEVRLVDDLQHLVLPPPRVRSHCRFRHRGTTYVCDCGIKWMSIYVVQSDNASEPSPRRHSATPSCASAACVSSLAIDGRVVQAPCSINCVWRITIKIYEAASE
jgi:hypothetical protein